MSAPLAIGHHVTVLTAPDDPIEITVHASAVITGVAADGYLVGHPPATRRYGPYAADRLRAGWCNER